MTCISITIKPPNNVHLETFALRPLICVIEPPFVKDEPECLFQYVEYSICKVSNKVYRSDLLLFNVITNITVARNPKLDSSQDPQDRLKQQFIFSVVSFVLRILRKIVGLS